jgi:hypothetical protein
MIKKHAKLNKKCGVKSVNLFNCLKYLGLHPIYKPSQKLTHIEKYLQQGFQCIINYKIYPRDKNSNLRHYVYIPSQTSKFLYATNVGEKALCKKSKIFFKERISINVFLVKRKENKNE